MPNTIPNSTPDSIEEMTGVIELITGLERHKLAEAVKQRWIAAEMTTPDDTALETWLDHLVEQMQTVPVNTEIECIIIGYPICEQDFDDPQHMNIHMTSSAFKTQALPEYDQSLLDDLMDSGKPSVTGYAYEFCDWKEILAWKTWVPKQTTILERYEFAADLIWELTFFGDTYDTASKRATEFTESLEESIAETKRWEEEGTLSEHTHSLDELKEKWNLPTPDPLQVELEQRMAHHMNRLNDLFLKDLIREIQSLSKSLGL